MKQIHYAARTGIPFLPAFLILVLACGCSNTGVKNKLGRVSGKVTLGGAPLPDALVMFSGIQGGSPSAGRTDATGAYTLVFSRNINGAEVGSHTVTISTYQPATDDPPKAEVPEKVPLKYRDPDSKDLLKADVKSGSNTLDFALEPGPVEAPQPKGKEKGKKPRGPVCS
jgi:hypothetical protein